MSIRDEEFGKSLLNTILTADGLILTLSWGLFDWSLPDNIKVILLWHLQWGSIFLALSLLSGVLCLQFMVSAAQSTNHSSLSVMKSGNVSLTFLICWIFFIIAIGLFVIGIWRL